MPSSFVASYIHIVFSTKGRHRLTDPAWEDRLFSYMGGVIRGMDGVPVAIGGVEDHAHVLAGLRSKHRLDYFVRDLKGDSSIWIRKEITRSFEWQKGYGAFSVSPSAVNSVSRYIKNQRAHHEKLDFKAEFISSGPVLPLRRGISGKNLVRLHRTICFHASYQKLRIWLRSFGGSAAVKTKAFENNDARGPAHYATGPRVPIHPHR